MKKKTKHKNSKVREDVPKGQLAGKIGVVIDLVTRLPVEIWFKENPRTNDTLVRRKNFKFSRVQILYFYQ